MGTKILIAFGEPIAHGGQEMFALNEYQFLDKNKYQIDFYTPYNIDNDEFVDITSKNDSKLYNDNYSFDKKARKYNFIRGFKNFIKKYGREYDIVHLNSGSTLVLSIGAKVAKKYGIKKVIVHSHCDGPNTIKHKITNKIFEKNFKYADNFLACSEDAAKYRFPKKIIINKKHLVIHNGINLEKYKFDKNVRNEYRKKLNIKENEILIGNVGRLSFQKNQLFLLDVFKELDNKYKLILIGDGEDKDQVIKKIKEYGIKDKVILLEKRPDVNKLLMAMDIFAFPSRFEGLSIAAIEAQASGLPILCSNNVSEDTKVSSYYKCVKDLNVEEWKKAIIETKIQRNDNCINEIDKAGYNIQKSVIELENVYNELANNKKILMIVNGGLPVPAIKGGAIETLMENVINFNEKTKKYNITVYSNYAKEIEKHITKYKKAEFKYINSSNFSYKLSHMFRGVLRRYFRLNILSTATKRIVKAEKKKINQYDLILVYNYISCIEPISKIYNGKIVLYLHNDKIINSKYVNGKNIIDKCYKILTVSDYISNTVLKVNDIGNVKRIYNGVDQSKFKPNMQERIKIRKKYNLKNDDFVFLFTGRVCEEKGVLQLVEVFKEVVKKHKNSKLVIVGSSFFSKNNDSPFIKKLKNITSSMQDKIIFTGYIKHSNIQEIYQASDVLMLPTMIEDAMPLTLLEGISCGLPAIVTNSGGMPEILGQDYKMIVERKNVHKELVKYMDKIISDDKTKNELAKNVLERSKKFSLEKYLNDFWKNIDCIIDEK